MKLLIPLCVLLTTLTWVHGDLSEISGMQTIMLDMLTIPAVPKDFKSDLYIYTVEKEKFKTATKFQCADINKKDSLYNINRETIILISNQKSKDGKDYIGEQIGNPTHNYIYLAYTDGKTIIARIKEYTLSLAHFLKCLVTNGVTMSHVGIEDNDFSQEVGAALGVLIENLNSKKKP